MSCTYSAHFTAPFQLPPNLVASLQVGSGLPHPPIPESLRRYVELCSQRTPSELLTNVSNRQTHVIIVVAVCPVRYPLEPSQARLAPSCVRIMFAETSKSPAVRMRDQFKWVAVNTFRVRHLRCCHACNAHKCMLSRFTMAACNQSLRLRQTRHQPSSAKGSAPGVGTSVRGP